MLAPLRVKRGAPFEHFGTLAVDDRTRPAHLASFALAGLDIECVMDALQRAVPIPQRCDTASLINGPRNF
jgi:hypothetical protein